MLRVCMYTLDITSRRNPEFLKNKIKKIKYCKYDFAVEVMEPDLNTFLGVIHEYI